MTLRYLFLMTVAGSSLLTSCMSSKEWVDDDVYVLKSVVIPADTDISDETDYNAYVYNRRNSQAQTSYYSQFYYSPMLYNRWMMYPGYYNNMGWVGSHGGYYGMAFYDPNYYSMFGYSYYYDPFWGYSTPYYYGGYGYGYPYYGYGYPYYGYGYGGNNGGAIASHPHFTGPRGAISGYGGVRSQSTQAYKSAPAGGAIASNQPARRATEATKTVNKPVTSYDRVGRTSGAPARTVNPATQPTVARGTTGTIQRSGNGAVTRNPVPRPETTTTRTENRGTYTGSPSRAGNSNGNYTTGSGRSQGTYSNGGTAPRQSTGSSGSSGSSRSGSSGGGTKTVGRR